MDVRRTAIVAGLLLLGGSAPGCEAASERVALTSLQTGAAAPAEWQIAPPLRPRTHLVWLVRTADCLTCQDVDYAFRRVHARWGRDVPLMVVHVGSRRSESVPRAFLESRRVAASFQTVSPRAFARRFGDAVIPAIYLINDGLIAWTSSDLRTPGAAKISLDSIVAAHRPPRRPASRAAAPVGSARGHTFSILTRQMTHEQQGNSSSIAAWRNRRPGGSAALGRAGIQRAGGAGDRDPVLADHRGGWLGVPELLLDEVLLRRTDQRL